MSTSKQEISLSEPVRYRRLVRDAIIVRLTIKTEIMPRQEMICSTQVTGPNRMTSVSVTWPADHACTAMKALEPYQTIEVRTTAKQGVGCHPPPKYKDGSYSVQIRYGQTAVVKQAG